MGWCTVWWTLHLRVLSGRTTRIHVLQYAVLLGLPEWNSSTWFSVHVTTETRLQHGSRNTHLHSPNEIKHKARRNEVQNAAVQKTSSKGRVTKYAVPTECIILIVLTHCHVNMTSRVATSTAFAFATLLNDAPVCPLCLEIITTIAHWPQFKHISVQHYRTCVEQAFHALWNAFNCSNVPTERILRPFADKTQITVEIAEVGGHIKTPPLHHSTAQQ